MTVLIAVGAWLVVVSIAVALHHYVVVVPRRRREFDDLGRERLGR